MGVREFLAESDTCRPHEGLRSAFIPTHNFIMDQTRSDIIYIHIVVLYHCHAMCFNNACFLYGWMLYRMYIITFIIKYVSCLCVCHNVLIVLNSWVFKNTMMSAVEKVGVWSNGLVLLPRMHCVTSLQNWFRIWRPSASLQVWVGCRSSLTRSTCVYCALSGQWSLIAMP